MPTDCPGARERLECDHREPPERSRDAAPGVAGQVHRSARGGNASVGTSPPTRVVGSSYASVRTLQGLQFPGTSHVHEVGHAIGLCHINGHSLRSAVMANPQQGRSERFVELEREAIRRVFRSGLVPGATHAEFREAGLIR